MIYIIDDCAKTKEREERDDAITLETLVGTISETMVIFQEFVFGDKKVTNCGGLIAKVDDALQHGLLLEVISSLDEVCYFSYIKSLLEVVCLINLGGVRFRRRGGG